MLINAYAERVGSGWLFEDIKLLFSDAGAVASEQPIKDADAWIAIRTDEWTKCPDVSRLVLQVHDLWSHTMPPYEKLGALVRAHPSQLPDYHLPGQVMTRPLGALRSMVPKQREDSSLFTFGWVGRPCGRRPLRRPEHLVNAVHKVRARGIEAGVLLAGEFFDEAIGLAKTLDVPIKWYRREELHPRSYADLYAQMDCLVLTSNEEAGPMPLFEALACGVPVLSMDAGWASAMLDDYNGWLYDGIDILVEHLVEATNVSFSSREEIAKDYANRDLWLDGPGGWIEQNMILARRLGR